MTLDAAFADPQAAAKLRQGRLTTGLRYSGLGSAGAAGYRGEQRAERARAPLETPSPRRTGSPEKRATLTKANHEAEQADGSPWRRCREAVKEAAAELILGSEIGRSAGGATIQETLRARAAAAKKRLSKGCRDNRPEARR